VKWLSLKVYTYAQLRFAADFVWVGSTLSALEIKTHLSIYIHVHIDSYRQLVKWLSLYTYTFAASFVWVGSTLAHFI